MGRDRGQFPEGCQKGPAAPVFHVSDGGYLGSDSGTEALPDQDDVVRRSSGFLQHGVKNSQGVSHDILFRRRAGAEPVPAVIDQEFGMGKTVQVGKHHGNIHGVPSVIYQEGLPLFFNKPSAEFGPIMVEGAPMRFPGGTFFQIRGFVLGLGRQVHQGTDGTLDACQSQNPGKQKCARDFPCSRFQYPQKIHGTFFSVVMAPVVPERSRAVPRSWQLQPFRKAVFSFASGRRTSFRSISLEAVLKCSSVEAAPWLYVTVAVSGTPPAISKVPLPSPSEW